MEAPLLQICKEIIAVPSVTDEGTRRVAEFCAARILAPMGIQARILPSHESLQQVNLFARIEGQDSSLTPLVFNTHLDTVPPGEKSLWAHCGGDPFAPTIVGDRLYGLGAADTKLDFVAKSYAIGLAGKPRRTVYLVGTFGEEHGLRGAKEMVRSEMLPRGAMVFVGEPSRLQAITANRGFMTYQLIGRFEPAPAPRRAKVLRVAFSGVAAHSSTPQLGENAIVKALRALAASKAAVVEITGGDATNKVPAHCEAIVLGSVWNEKDGRQTRPIEVDVAGVLPTEVIEALLSFIEDLLDFAEHSGPAEPDIAAPTLTSNPGILRSQPGEITLEFELRPPPSLALDEVRKSLAQIADRIRHRFPRFKFDLVELRANPGFRSEMDRQIVALAAETMADAGLPVEFAAKRGCTEAGIYAAADLEPIVFGPGPSVGVIHAPDEYNLLRDVEGAIRFYRTLLSR